MAQVRWSLTAAEDLQEIEAFAARDSPVYAVRLVDAMVPQSRGSTPTVPSRRWDNPAMAPSRILVECPRPETLGGNKYLWN